MVLKKRLSKRIPLKLQYKVKRKQKEALKKRRRDDKVSKKRAEKDKIVIPNDFPLKGEILKQVQEERDIAALDKTRRARKLRNKRIREASLAKEVAMQDGDAVKEVKEVEESRKKGPTSIEELASTAAARSADFIAMEEHFRGQGTRANTMFVKQLNTVVGSSDVILFLLDCRDPMGSRSEFIEQTVLSRKKKLIFVLNKSDLVPKGVYMRWEKYLKNATGSRTRVIPFSSIKIQKSRTASSDLLGKIKEVVGAGGGVVGIVGFPNVGKSSLLNVLKGGKVVKTSSTAGQTRVLQTVKIGKNLTLIDSPGVVPPNSQEMDLSLRNCNNVNLYEEVAQRIFNLIGHEKLALFYRMSTSSVFSVFMKLLAKRLSLVKKGAILDIRGAAARLVTDWQNGGIRYYTTPPVMPSGSTLGGEEVDEDLKDLDQLNQLGSVFLNEGEKSIVEPLVLEPENKLFAGIKLLRKSNEEKKVRLG